MWDIERATQSSSHTLAHSRVCPFETFVILSLNKVITTRTTDAYRCDTMASTEETTQQSLTEQTDYFLKNERWNPPEDLLEALVDEQVSKHAPYHRKANLALLKQYQFKPERRDLSYCAKILMLALSYPDDFLPYMYMLPESVQCAEPVSTLARLSVLLESCHFAEFWDEVRTEGQSIALLKDMLFADGVREHIARVISATYQKCPFNIIVDSMRFNSDADMSAFFTERKWKRDGDIVVIPQNGENKAKPMKFRETMSFNKLAPMLGGLSY